MEKKFELQEDEQTVQLKLPYTKWSVDKAGSYSMGEAATDVELNLYLVARRHLLPKIADLQVHVSLYMSLHISGACHPHATKDNAGLRASLKHSN